MPNAKPAWTARVWLDYRAGNLTRAYRDVLLTLHSFRGTGGHCWPSHATLADRARCCVRTVQRALQQGQRLGLVDWSERRVRAGWRWLQSSNLYRFMVPADIAVQPGMQPPRKAHAALTDSKAGEGRGSKKDALDAVLREAVALPDLLAMRRAAFAAGWQTERGLIWPERTKRPILTGKGFGKVSENLSMRVSVYWINPTGAPAQAQPRFSHRFGRDPKYAEIT